MVVKCLAIGQSKDDSDYGKVVDLVEEVRPWFRVLDPKEYEKFHRAIVTYLGRSTLFLFAELNQFNGHIVHRFSVTTLTEYANSSTKNQFHKFSRQLCSSLFSLQENKPSLTADILFCILDFVAHECKGDREEAYEIEFLQLVAYCASKCQAARAVFSRDLAAHLNDLSHNFCQVMTPCDLILRLYAVGLSFIDYDLNSKDGGIMSSSRTKDVHAVMVMVDGGEGQHNLATLIHSLQNYFQVDCKDHWESSSVGCSDSVNQSCSQLVSNHAASIISRQESRKAYLLSYLNALKFLCQPLAELVHSEKKQLVLQNGSPFSTKLCGVQDTFHQLCEVILFLYSGRSERKRDDVDDNNTMLSVAVAALILSIRTKLNLKKSVHLIKHIIASRWILPQGLKYLFASLYNVGVLLFRNNLMKEASNALTLSCRASWTCVTLLCQMFVDKLNTSGGDVSEDAIVDFVVEVCTRSASLLDVLYQCDSHKVKKTIIYCLENWSLAGKLFRRLPSPLPLAKQWVKIRCRLLKNKDIEDNVPSLYHLLSSSLKVSKEAIGIILEQELLACEELNAMYPQFCLSMQTEIMDLLLQFVYVTRDSALQKSRVLLRRGRAFRTCGIEGLKSCIQCLSEAISIVNDMYVEACIGQSLVCHQLAMAFCLRALCTQEAEPNSQQEVLQDISAALKLWLSIRIQDYGLTNNEHGIVSENIMLLLYNVIDLLGMKGYMDFHHDIYRLMIRLFKWKNVPLEKYLSILWESRRFSHALCVSPIDEAFIINLSEHCGEPCKSIDFWMRCLNQSQTSLLAFQQIFSFFFSKPPCGSYKHENCLQSDIVAGIKETALELTSKVPTTSNSLFLAAYLCYDLCERLISNGRLLEALSFAKEAHRLRTKLFQEKFIYSVEHQVGINDGARNRPQKLTYLLRDMQLLRSVATEVWSFDSISWDIKHFYLSPWKVLQCYLESTLQVGIIQEIIGNSAEAETFLLWGKEISRSQSLSLFAVSFSSILGKLYCKKRLWDWSERELQSAKKILADDKAVFSCHKCRLMLEVAVDQQLGDLSRNQVDNSTGNGSPDMLSCAENWYKSALEKLNRCNWKNSVSCPEEASLEITMVEDSKNIECVGHLAKLQADTRNTVSKKEGPKAKIEAKKCLKVKNAPRSLPREQPSIPEHNFRITRSRCQSSQNQQISICTEKQADLSQQSEGHSGSNFPGLISNNESDIGVESNTIDKGSEIMCICDKLNCWFCLAKEVMASGLVPDFIHMKWEFIRRRFLLRVLTGIGKCMGDKDQIHETHDIMMQSISVLVIRNPFCRTHSSVSTNFLLDLVGKEFSRDVFAIERASILYNLCWFSLKSYFHRESRENCCVLFNIELPKIVSWLKLAFVLCREVPILFQKVSRLLAALYIIYASNGDFPTSFSGKALSESNWASYFHQASLGTHLNYQFSSTMKERFKAEDTKDLHVTSSACIIEEKWKIPRFAPDSVQDLEQFVADFFARLPRTTIICISLLGGVYVSIFQELLNYPSCVGAWMLLSRMRSKNQPMAILLPVDAVLNEDLNDVNSGSLEFPGSKDPSKHWHCPWGSTVVDEVAPTFKMILEENYKSSSSFALEDTKENRSLWWRWRQKLDYQLSNFLRNLEDSWLGPWRYMLLGGWSNHCTLDRVHKKLMRDLKTKCKMDVNESFLNVIIGGARHALEEETDVVWLCSKKGCYVGKAGYCNEEEIEKLPNTSKGIKKNSELAFQLIQEAIDELEEEENFKREPVILVLDWEVQMLPWENLPVLRNQEVYRMPSIGSILVTLERSRCHLQQQVGGIVTTFPVIDPLDAFYLLNPSGDLSSTQFEFEKWFREHNLKGKAGSAPTTEELALALKSHDLFIYLGHGSGAQYIPAKEIQKLENCAATLLMGCSSGCLSLNGSYIPQGTPISYLLAGSPIIVANLWEVTDKDIDRFGKAMLDAWLTERSTVQCDLVAKEFETLNIRTRKGNAKKKLSKKKLSEACDNDSCDHRPKVGSFISQAREACTLPFLIGASPVCYGVPTGIWRKDL